MISSISLFYLFYTNIYSFWDRSGQPSESRNRTNKKVRQREKRTEKGTSFESAIAAWKLSLADVWIGWLFVGAWFKMIKYDEICYDCMPILNLVHILAQSECSRMCHE